MQLSITYVKNMNQELNNAQTQNTTVSKLIKEVKNRSVTMNIMIYSDSTNLVYIQFENQPKMILLESNQVTNYIILRRINNL